MAWLAVFAMGLVLGTVGGGGGILTVPILVGLFGFSATSATGGSLLIVGLTSSVGAVRGLIKKEADVKPALALALPSSIGAFLARALIVPSVPATIAGTPKDKFLLGGFAILIAVVGIRMALPKRETEPIERGFVVVALTGAVIGIVSGTFGAGGGFLILPALILVLGIETKRAISTSLMVISIQSLVGFLGELGKPVQWTLLLSIAGVAIGGLILGTLVRSRLPVRMLQITFSVIALGVAVWMVARLF